MNKLTAQIYAPEFTTKASEAKNKESLTIYLLSILLELRQIQLQQNN